MPATAHPRPNPQPTPPALAAAVAIPLPTAVATAAITAAIAARASTAYRHPPRDRAAGRLTLLRTTSSRVVTIGEYFEEATLGLRSSCMCISNIHARPNGNAPSVTSCLRALTSQHSTDALKSTLSLPLLVRSFPL